jgi:hypothetical protein
MHMVLERCKSVGLRLVVAVAAMTTMIVNVGCGSSGGAKYKNMPADQAWRAMQYDDNQDVEVAKWMRVVTGNNSITQSLDAQATRTREALQTDSALSTEAIDGLSDEMAQNLVNALLAYSANKPYRLVIAVGKFEDRSPAPNPYVSSILDRVFTRLEQNQQVTNNYRLIRSSKTDAAAVLEEIGIDPNTRSPRAGGSLVQGVNPDALHVLTGYYVQQPSARVNDYGIDQGATSPVDATKYTVETLMNYRVEKVTSRETVQGTSQEIAQLHKWHPYQKKWMGQSADAAAAATYRNELAAKAASTTK